MARKVVLKKVTLAELPLTKWLVINLKYKYQEERRSLLGVRSKGIQVFCEILKARVH